MPAINWSQVRQALEKISLIEAAELSKALAEQLYTSWDTVLRALINVASQALEETSQEQETLTEKTIVEEQIGGTEE